jgi:hypothetical protein
MILRPNAGAKSARRGSWQTRKIPQMFRQGDKLGECPQHQVCPAGVLSPFVFCILWFLRNRAAMLGPPKPA